MPDRLRMLAGLISRPALLAALAGLAGALFATAVGAEGIAAFGGIVAWTGGLVGAVTGLVAGPEGARR